MMWSPQDGDYETALTYLEVDPRLLNVHAAVLIMNTMLLAALGSKAKQPFRSLQEGRKPTFRSLQMAIPKPSVPCGSVQNPK